MQQPDFPVAAIVGTSSVAHLQEAWEAQSIQLTLEELAQLRGHH